MRTLLSELRRAPRMVLRSPGFAAGAVLTLALGIGAATAVFTVVNVLILRPLPFRAPDRLVRITVDLQGRRASDVGIAIPELFDLSQRADVFEQMSGVYPIDANLSGTDEPERIEAQLVSVGYFAMLGVNAQLGRVFTAGDYQPGIAERAVISDSLWVRRFGRDPNVLGRKIRIDNDMYEIIGVTPPGFEHPGRHIEGRTDLWAPSGYRASPFGQPVRGSYQLTGALARLAPGVSVRDAQAQLDLYARDVARAFPADYPASLGWHARVIPLRDDLVGETRPALAVLTGAVALVLLIACANVANLLLARGATRQRELAIRRALGAGTGRIVAQLCAESAVLALPAGGLALLITVWSIDAVTALIPPSVTTVSRISVDATVAAFAVLAAMGSVLIFGLVPALHAARPGASAVRDTSRRTTASVGRQRARTVLATAQCALALVLLIGATLLVRTFQQLHDVNLGFESEDVLTARIWMPQPNIPSDGPYFRHEQRLPFFRAVEDRLRALPGVEAVGWVRRLPLVGRAGVQPFLIDGRPLEDRNVSTAEVMMASDSYFSVLGIPLRRGRMFTLSDKAGAPPVMLVNEAFVRRYFPGEDPIGRRTRPGGPASTAPWRTIVGVVGDVRSSGMDRPAEPQAYIALTQFSSLAMSMVIKTRGGDPATLAEAIRADVRRVDPEMPVYAIETMDRLVGESVGQRRFAATLLMLFSVFALVLACVGVYGVIAYLVTQRTQEFGIRMALGAQRSDVMRIVLLYGGRIATAGIAIGLAAAVLLTRWLQTLLFEVSPTDAATFVGVPVALGMVALSACYLPARRAIRINPVEALRHE
jgi:putative ABC transport system permease protein